MNRPPNPKQKDSAPIADPIDFLLDEELAGSVEELAPSSGFVLSVMESIHAQAAEPPPIAFPWSRVVPGAIAALCCLAALIVFGLRTLHAGTTATRAPQVGALLAHSLPRAFTVEEVTLCGVLMAACLSVAAVAASFRLTGRRQ
jgi:hypothetical protein